MAELKTRKRGPNKKAGFRQELRVTPLVEKVFNNVKDKYNLKNNSEALHKIAEIHVSSQDDAYQNI